MDVVTEFLLTVFFRNTGGQFKEGDSSRRMFGLVGNGEVNFNGKGTGHYPYLCSIVFYSSFQYESLGGFFLILYSCRCTVHDCIHGNMSRVT